MVDSQTHRHLERHGITIQMFQEIFNWFLAINTEHRVLFSNLCTRISKVGVRFGVADPPIDDINGGFYE